MDSCQVGVKDADSTERFGNLGGMEHFYKGAYTSAADGFLRLCIPLVCGLSQTELPTRLC